MNLFLPSDPRPLHFVGIAGAGMSALAAVALRRGVAVTGSDRAPEGASDLAGLGAKILQGHAPEAVAGARALIVSAAVPADHPEIERAHALGIPVVARKAALAALVEGGRTVAVAGTHGKTTTTVMATEALAAAGLNPTGLAGGRVAGWGGNARLGGEALFVVEADEYDRAFLALRPEVAVITNVEPEHLECYEGSADLMESAFVQFAGRAGVVLAGNADAGSDRVARQLESGFTMRGRGRLWRFGPGARDLEIGTVAASPAGSRAPVRLPDGREVSVTLSVPGMHNMRNAVGALGTVVALGGAVEPAVAALEAFGGVGRRFEWRGEAGGVVVVDDYAHHPTEVAATMAAARQAHPGRRVVAVFQPHLYSRTAVQAAALGPALAQADLVFVTEIYAAREVPIPGVTGASVAASAAAAGAEVRFAGSRDELLGAVLAALRPGDLVLTLGAGDITSFGPVLLAGLMP